MITKKNNKEIAEKIFNKNEKLAYYLANKMIRQWTLTDPEELTQAALTGLWKGCLSIDMNRVDNGEIKISTYLSPCISNEMLMLASRKKKKVTEVSLSTDIGGEVNKSSYANSLEDILPDNNYNTEADLILNEDIKKLYENINKLPTKIRDVMRARLENKTQAEIAKVMGISRAYVSKLYQMGVKRLKLLM